MYDFTKKKFLDLPVERQHKKCAELLKNEYERLLLQNETHSTNRETYNELMDWMKEVKIDSWSFEAISNRFHYHLKKALISKSEHNLLPLVRKGDREVGKEKWSIDIYLDHIRSAHNIGSILRTVEAFGLGTVYFSEETAFIDHPQVQSTSMGAYEWIECKKGIELAQLKKPIIALETASDALSIFDFIFPDEFTLVIGNEEYGCSENAIKHSNIILEIPLRGRKNSLNVANAFSIAAGEIYRQRARYAL